VFPPTGGGGIPPGGVPGGGGGTGPNFTFTLCDLADCVIRKVENRTTDQTRALEWLRDALIEISSNGEYRDDFIDLEILGPTFNLTAGTREYSEASIIPVGDLNIATLDIRVWVDPPTNSRWIKLDPSHYQRADASSTGQSQPGTWYRFGYYIGFDPIPDKAYQVQARVLRFHPIAYADLCHTVILLPRDWNEILCWAAAERGFMELEEYEKAAAIHTRLFGDPENPNKPGLIAGRIKKRENESWRQQKTLRPTVRQATSFRW
jgi:hypothetical protein